MSGEADFEARLTAMLERNVEGFDGLRALDRLSGGASQQTFCVTIALRGGVERKLALRRSVGDLGVGTPTSPGPATEALLMQAVREVGVPEPEVLHVLTEEDDLGEGFLMEWLEGETLGARIARAPEFEAVRRGLAFECGEVLARIHSVDLEKTGLARRLARLTPEQYVRMTWEGYKALDTHQPMIDYTGRWLLSHLPPECPPRLVHNDFRNGNLIIGPDGLRAVLDWEASGIGAPMSDLAWMCVRMWRFGNDHLPVGGFATVDDLRAGYEEAGGRWDDDAFRWWMVLGSLRWGIGLGGQVRQHIEGEFRSIVMAGSGRRIAEMEYDVLSLLA